MAIDFPTSGGAVTAESWQLGLFDIPTTGSFVFRYYPYFAAGDTSARYVFRAYKASSLSLFDYVKDGTTWYCGWYTATAEYRLSFTNDFTQNAWSTAVLTWDDTSNATEAFVNNVSKATNSSLVTWATSGSGRMVIGNGATNDIETASAYGRLADMAFFDFVLTADQRASYEAGFQAPAIAKPFRYWPMVRESSEIAAATAVTVAGTAAIEHPRIIQRRRTRTVYVPNAAAPAYYSNLLTLGVG